MRILINALSGIGDALMFSPALAVLKKHLPESSVDMMVMFRPVREIYRNNPNIDNIYFIDFLKQSKLKSLKKVISLRSKKYDYALNVYPSNRKEYNMISFLTGARKELAVKYRNYSGINLDFLNSNLKRELLNRHNVLENLDLVKIIVPGIKDEEAGDLELFPEKDNDSFAAEYIAGNLVKGKMTIGFHAGSAMFKGHINKRWYWKKYAELAIELNKKYSANILLFGTETELNEKIKNHAGQFLHIPESGDINRSIALIKRCNLFVSNDSALMHLAAALKIPQVAVFAYTNQNELYPWKNRHIIVRKELNCSPCFFNSPKPVKCIYKAEEKFKCIKDISVSEVMEACSKLIEEIPGNVKP